MLSWAGIISYCTQRRVISIAVWIVLVVICIQLYDSRSHLSNQDWRQPEALQPLIPYIPPTEDLTDGKFHWRNVPVQFPRESLLSLPTGHAESIPRIQHVPAKEDTSSRAIRLERLAAVKDAIQHAWSGYREHAWMADEVAPLSGQKNNAFGGWAASLVDALDTLWIAGMKQEFEEAVNAIGAIDFTETEEDELNVFETTIRYMGGFLGAYDLSNGQYPLLLTKALELGEMLLVSFDTPNHMPCTRWRWRIAKEGEKQEASSGVLVAEIGSLTLEFTRLSQITGDMRFYDAVQRIMDVFDQQQMQTRLPGMWGVLVNAKNLDFRSDGGYTLGAMADSLYEYLPKVSLYLCVLKEQH